MKNKALIFIVLIILGVISGSVFTYYFYISEASSLKKIVNETAENPTAGEESEEIRMKVAQSKPDIVGTNKVVDAVKILSPSVVFITTKSVFGSESELPPGVPREFRDFFNPYGVPKRRQGSGSGIIISEDGLILTNQHVIEGADQITVKIGDEANGDKEKLYRAKVIGSDRLTDIAIIKIEAENLPAAKLGDSDRAQIGEWVVAVGNPYGYEHTVTVGVLSARRRDLSDMGREYPNLLQTDAAINPGNSGGPLANLKGEIIGVNTAVHRTGQGIGFAIPINQVKKIKDQLIGNGKVVRPFIGIQMMEMDEAKANYLNMPEVAGVLIYRTVKNSPAQKAGLARGDVILEIDGKKVNSSKELQEIIRSYDIGDTVNIKVWRKDSRRDFQLKIEEMPSELSG
ncbi:MAG: trypsin-like peptidase domain-containing protein [Vulcanimicrobiota bacterium]